MINYLIGDLMSTPDLYIAHGCNCQGVMGSGVALQIKNSYPEAYKDYRRYITNTDIPQLGHVIPSRQPNGKTILNCLTQYQYGRDGMRYVSYDAVDLAMQKLSYILGKDAVSMPKIGAGYGGGDWEVIESIIKNRLHKHTVNIFSLT